MKTESEENALEHMNLVLRAIRNINRLIVREKDRDRLIKGVCDNLTENRSYHNAWIALFDESDNLVTTAESGLGNQFSPLLARLRKGELTDCARKALSQSGPVLTANPVSTCRDCPLSSGYGGRGAMTIRLDHEGRIYGIASVCVPKDLTADKEEKELLKEVAGDVAFALHSLELNEKYRRTADEYRTIFETTGTATIIIRDDTTISLANKMFEDLSGYSKEEIEGKKSWTDFVADKKTLLKMEAYHILRRMDPDSAPRNYEYKFVDRHGTVKDMFSTIAMIPGTSRSVGSFLDITGLKQAEEAIRESEQRFRHLVQNSLTGIFIVQKDHIVFMNPEQGRLFGSLPEAFTLANFEGIHPDDAKKVKENYQKLLSGRIQTLDMDFRLYLPGKTDSKPDKKWVHCRASTIEYQGEKALLINMMDLTQAKEMERLLIIQDKMASLGRVAAGIAHEIRNPLSGINIYLDTLEKIYDDPESLETVKGILTHLHSASAKIESVIRRVMDFSKPSEPKMVSTDINQPIEEAIGLSSVTLRKSGITITKNLSPGLQPLDADPNLLEEVFLNLITNAAESMKKVEKEKHIEVASSEGKRHIIVTVSDSGPGVPPSLKDKIFDPFFTTKSESTGIGLSLSHRIIADHEGSMGVSRSEWGGAKFVIRIPKKKRSH